MAQKYKVPPHLINVDQHDVEQYDRGTVLDITGNAADGPAIYINRLVVTGSGMIKISFMEQDSETRPAHFRSAVIMPNVVAAQMIEIVRKTLDKSMKQQADEDANV
jgi:hypothetical protein